jgi:hypothetical protein
VVGAGGREGEGRDTGRERCTEGVHVDGAGHRDVRDDRLLRLAPAAIEEDARSRNDHATVAVVEHVAEPLDRPRRVLARQIADLA